MNNTDGEPKSSCNFEPAWKMSDAGLRQRPSTGGAGEFSCSMSGRDNFTGKISMRLKNPEKGSQRWQRFDAISVTS
jgi:hypothetical protein